jgi:hypothetical protein
MIIGYIITVNVNSQNNVNIGGVGENEIAKIIRFPISARKKISEA